MSTRPDERAGRGLLRAGHADREQVIADLKAAFVQGRLDQDELAERAGLAVTSRTYAELAALTADLPAPAGAAGPARVSTPGRTLARAAGRAGVCMLAAVAFAEAAFLVDNFLLMVVAFFAAIAAGGFMGCGILDALQERRSPGHRGPRCARARRGRRAAFSAAWR